MEDFISYSNKDKFTTIFMVSLLSVLTVFSLLEKIIPISLSLFMLGSCLFFINEKRTILNRYKIINNSLLIKKIKKTQIFSFDTLEKVVFNGKIFLLKFPKETIKIFYDKNTSKIVDYFLKNNLESIYNQKYLEIDKSKQFINIDKFSNIKHRRLKLILIFIISLLIVIDLVIEKTKDFRIIFFAGIAVFCAVASFCALIFSYTRKSNYNRIEQEYIDKDGFHLFENFISFHEISEIFKIIKKWNIVNLKIKTKDNREYEIPTFSFNGDLVYEMYLAKKINT